MPIIFIYPLYIIHIYKNWYGIFQCIQNIFSEERFCYYHNFYKMEICQFYEKVCSGELGLSLHIYHSFECFQKLTDISKKYHNYSLSDIENLMVYFNINQVEKGKILQENTHTKEKRYDKKKILWE